MAQPFNYSIDVPNPAQSFTQGLQQAATIRGLQLQQQQQEQAQAQQQALRTDLTALYDNPNPANVAKLMTKYPQLGEQFKRTYDVLNTEQQQARVQQASQVYAALQAGEAETAEQLLRDQATAYRNSGMEGDAKAAEVLAGLVKASPSTALTSAGMFLATAMGPEKFTETFSKLESERRLTAGEEAALTKAQSEAREAAVKAKFAESNAVKDLEKKGWDIFKIQEDVKVARQNANIAALNASINRESNEIKKQELQVKLEELKKKRDDEVRTKAADVESARSNVDNMLNTADRILKTPLDVIESATGPISSRMPTTSQSTADFEELINTLSSQSFLAQIPNIKGMGALSNAEGEKLQAALQSFSLRQSPDQLTKNIKEAQRLLLKARKNLTTRFGVPETIPDTPEATPGAEEIDALLKKYGGG